MGSNVIVKLQKNKSMTRCMSNIMYRSVKQIKTNVVQLFWLSAEVLLSVCCFCFIMGKNYSTSANLSYVSRHVFCGLFNVSDFSSWICIFSEMLLKLHGTKPSHVVSLYCHLLYFHYSLVKIVNIREMQNKTAILHELFLWFKTVEII